MEPVDLENTDKQVPDRLQKIINVLQDYHSKIIQNLTINSQDPDRAKTIVTSELRKIGSRLKLCLKDKNSCPELNIDSEFRGVYEKLDSLRSPWDPNISTLLMEYIDTLFFECPLANTIEHCKRLRMYAQEYGQIVDGTE